MWWDGRVTKPPSTDHRNWLADPLISDYKRTKHCDMGHFLSQMGAVILDTWNNKYIKDSQCWSRNVLLGLKSPLPEPASRNQHHCAYERDFSKTKRIDIVLTDILASHNWGSAEVNSNLDFWFAGLKMTFPPFQNISEVERNGNQLQDQAEFIFSIWCAQPAKQNPYVLVTAESL